MFYGVSFGVWIGGGVSKEFGSVDESFLWRESDILFCNRFLLGRSCCTIISVRS